MSSLLKVSEADAIALHATALMAARPDQRFRTKALAEALGVSQAHLAKVLQRLVQAGLVNSERGPAGGFQLAQPPEALTLMQVYEALEGPFNPDRCLMPHPVCNGRRKLLGNLLDKLIEDFEEYFRGTTLAEVAEAMDSAAAKACKGCPKYHVQGKKTGSPPETKTRESGAA